MNSSKCFERGFMANSGTDNKSSGSINPWDWRSSCWNLLYNRFISEDETIVRLSNIYYIIFYMVYYLWSKLILLFVKLSVFGPFVYFPQLMPRPEASIKKDHPCFKLSSLDNQNITTYADGLRVISWGIGFATLGERPLFLAPGLIYNDC